MSHLHERPGHTSSRTKEEGTRDIARFGIRKEEAADVDLRFPS